MASKGLNQSSRLGRTLLTSGYLELEGETGSVISLEKRQQGNYIAVRVRFIDNQMEKKQNMATLQWKRKDVWMKSRDSLGQLLILVLL